MAISINGITVAGIGKDGKNGTDGKDATVNGVNALNIEATGGITGQQSGDTYTIDGSGLFPKTGGELSGNIAFTEKTFMITDVSGAAGFSVDTETDKEAVTLGLNYGERLCAAALSKNSIIVMRKTANGGCSLEMADYGIALMLSTENGDLGLIMENDKITFSGKQFLISDGSEQNKVIATQDYVDTQIYSIIGKFTEMIETKVSDLEKADQDMKDAISYLLALVGNINTTLDTINGEVI